MITFLAKSRFIGNHHFWLRNRSTGVFDHEIWGGLRPKFGSKTEEEQQNAASTHGKTKKEEERYPIQQQQHIEHNNKPAWWTDRQLIVSY